MNDSKLTQPDATQRAIDKFSDPEVYYHVGLASSPAAAKKIAESLPGVRELLEIGPEAGRAILDLLQKTFDNSMLSTITLYLIWRIPNEESKETLAKLIVSRQFTGINSQLAAEAFLVSARIDVPHENAIDLALSEAKKLRYETP